VIVHGKHQPLQWNIGRVHNKYSVAARAVGRPVEIQGYAARIVIRQDGAIVGDHVRCFGRNQTISGGGYRDRG